MSPAKSRNPSIFLHAIVLLLLAGGPAWSATISSHNPGGVGNNANAGFDFDTWFIAEVSLASTERFSPSVTLDIFDSIVGGRDITMYLFTGDGSVSAPASGTLTAAAAFASQTVTSADLGPNLASATTVTWSFPGVTVPTNLIVGVELADSDVAPTSLAVISATFSPVVVVGTSHGRNFSNDDAINWVIQPNNQTNVGFVNFTIDASAGQPVPEPSTLVLAGLGLAVVRMASRHRRRKRGARAA